MKYLLAFIAGALIYISIDSSTFAQTSSPTPRICPEIQGIVPEAVIQAAVANPEKVPNWNLLYDSSKPEGPDNLRMTYLTIKSGAYPYEPSRNGLWFREKCNPYPPENEYEAECGCRGGNTCSFFCGVYGTDNLKCTSNKDCIGAERNTVRTNVLIQGTVTRPLKVTALLYRFANDQGWRLQDTKTQENVKFDVDWPSVNLNFVFDNLPLDRSTYITKIKLDYIDNQAPKAYYEMSVNGCSGRRNKESCDDMTIPGFGEYIITIGAAACKEGCVYSKNVDGATKCYKGICDPLKSDCNFNVNCQEKLSCDSGEVECPREAPAFVQRKSQRNILLIISNPMLISKKMPLFSYYPKFPTKPEDLANNVLLTINKAIGNTANYVLDEKNIIRRDTFFPLTKPVDMEIYEKDLLDCQGSLFGLNEYDRKDPSGPCARVASNTVDYNKLFSEHNVCQRVNSDNPSDRIDEVWEIVAPYIGVGENDMVGPNPFFINGLTIVNTECKRNVPTLSIDPTRNAHLAVHSFGHRIESTMKMIYGSWDNPPKNNWDFFIANYKDLPTSGCGSIHYPPNTLTEYGYNEVKDFKANTCESFWDYPYIAKVATTQTNCSQWSCRDSNFYQWWLNHIPAKEGVGPDGKLQNWWDYINNPEKAIADTKIPTLKKSVDINSDGEVNTFDLAMVIDSYGDLHTDVQSFDVVDDGVINALDYSAVVSYLSGQSDASIEFAEIPVSLNPIFHKHVSEEVLYLRHKSTQQTAIVKIEDNPSALDPANSH